MKNLKLISLILLFQNGAYGLDSSRLMRNANFCFDKRNLSVTPTEAQSLVLSKSVKGSACASDVAISWRTPKDPHEGELEILVLAENQNHQLRQFLFSVPSIDQSPRIILNDPILGQICDKGLQFDVTKNASLTPATGDAATKVNAVFKSSPPVEKIAHLLAEDMRTTALRALGSPTVSSTAIKVCWAGLLSVISDFGFNDIVSKDDKAIIENHLYPADFNRPQDRETSDQHPRAQD